jgi:signal transduction histidine kinase
MLAPRPRLAPGSLQLDRSLLVTAGSLGVLLSTGAAVVSLTGSVPDDGAFALGVGLSIAIPVAVGLYAWRGQIHTRFGRLLVLIGLASFFPALATAGNDLVYSVGRIADWFVVVALIYLMLAFPTGRLPGTPDRALFLSAVGLVAILFLPTALIVHQYPLPTEWTNCRDGCPSNAFMLLHSQPAFVDGFVVPLREALAITLFLAIPARLAYRIRNATPLMRRSLTPVVAFAIITTLAFAFGFAVRRADSGASVLQVLVVVIVLGLPTMSLGFLIGLLRWRLFVASALQRLAFDVRGHPRPDELRDVIAETLCDPTVELAFRNGDGWTDATGTSVTSPAERPGRTITYIREGDRRVAVVDHDSALRDQRAFVRSVGAYALSGYENLRLAADVDASIQDLADSRARILAAADEERRRIERDLHDGAQQRLVALRIRLELAEEQMQQDPVRAKELLHHLGDQVTDALDDVRSLAKGVYPSVLVDRGLAEALRSVALRSPMPVTVDVDGGDNYTQEVEAAAYFCCLEALQNAAKHASHATSVAISLRRNGDLRFEVSDDGPGFSPSDGDPGHGLVNMRDRVEAVGGKLDIRSAPGEGTRVIGRVPV